MSVNPYLGVKVTAGMVVAETAKALTIELPTSLPCPTDDIFSIPKLEDLLKPLQEIAQLPEKLDAKLALMKKEKEDEIVVLVERLKNPELTQEERTAIIEEIEIAEAYVENVLGGELLEQIRDIQKQIEKYFEGLEKLLSPFWKKTEGKRDWQQELEDALGDLLAEFHIYIPVKVSEIIQKLIPLNLTIPILGLEIDIIKLITDPNYKKELEDMIAGKNFVTQIIAKKKRLAEVNERLSKEIYVLNTEEIEKLEKEKTQLEKDITELGDLRTAWVDKFLLLVPKNERGFDGELSELDNDQKAKLIWKYIKKEIKEWVLNLHMKAFEKLIGMFQEIWDALGLPSLPLSEIAELLKMDVPALLEKLKKTLKDKFMTTSMKIKERLEDIEGELAVAELDGNVEEIEKVNIEKRELEAKLLLEKGKYLRGLEDLILGFEIPIIGMTIEEIMGGENISTNSSIEDRLKKFEAKLDDFVKNWQQKLLFAWVKLIKKFIQAIGLGALIDLILLTFCDFLKLIGNPFAIMITIPSLEGIIESSTYKPKVRVPSKLDAELDSNLSTSDGTEETNLFAIEGTTGDLKVFINGVKQVDNYTVVGTNVIMDTILEKGLVVCAIKVPTP
jgi:hypothetical protein